MCKVDIDSWPSYYFNGSYYIHIELLSGSIGWGTGLQSSRLVQGKGSNPLKVLIKEN